MSNLSLPAGRLSTPYTDGTYRVYPNSLLFREGNYADKNYSMTPAEIAAAAASFAPVSVNLEHAPAMLVGKLGEVRRAYVDPAAPGELRGEVAIPTWLDDQLTDAERQVSSEFNRETKMLVGLALTPSPRVEGAALMAAFSNAQEPGRVPGNPGGQPAKRSQSMEIMDEVKALLTKAGFSFDKKPEPPDPNAELKATIVALSAKVDELSKPIIGIAEPIKKVASFSESDAKSKAGEFVCELLAAHKCLPAEREAIESGFIASFKADTQVATFSGDALLTPVTDAFKASQRARVAHGLTTEILVDTSPDAVLFAYGPSGKPEAKKMKSPDEIMHKHNAQHRFAMGGNRKEAN
jgi:hypothetical protein